MNESIQAEVYLLSEEESGKRTGIRTGFTDKVFCSTWDQVCHISSLKNWFFFDGV